MVEWLAGNRIRGTNTERVGASVAQATPTKIIDGNYTVLTYTADGKFIPKDSFNVEYLVVAGGGGGGATTGGGGGAGGFRTNVSGATSGGGSSAESTYGVTAQNYNITIGAGGAGAYSGVDGSAGSDSSIVPTSGTSIISIGGGRGGRGNIGGNGGSGGGAGDHGGGGGTATANQGYAGGNGIVGSPYVGGGGGGAGGVGQTASTGVAGNGGAGLSSSITGTSICYAGGGGAGGGVSGTFGTATCGGTAGVSGSNEAAVDASANTGGGGGGANAGSAGLAGGGGGSGIVILRFLTSGNDYDVEAVGFMQSLPSGSVGGWHEVGRTTLDSTGNNIDVSSLPDKRYYMFLTHAPTDSSGYVLDRYRLNADTGSNYSFNSGLNGSAFGTGSVSQSEGIVLSDGASIHPSGEIFTMGYISNVSGKEKLLIGNTLHNDTAGSGTAPDIAKGVGKHAQTSNPVTSVNVVNTNNSGFASGSEVVVLGWDHEDVHTTNFWEELASADWSSGASIDTGTFTAKKYLWVQISYQNSTANWSYLTFNDDTTGANYASRHSSNGATASPTAPYSNNESFYQLLGTGSSGTYTNNFVNMFIINNTSNEKLVISNSVQIESTGAGNAPTTRREGVGKWTNTSDQITQIKLVKSSNNLSGGTIKVWGSD